LPGLEDGVIAIAIPEPGVIATTPKGRKPPRKYKDKDRHMLFMRSGGICAYKGCRTRLYEDARGDDPEVLLADIGHIVSLSDTGPRANREMPIADRNGYANLILLCPTHHRLVDGQTSTHTVEELREWKNAAEQRFDRRIQEFMPRVTYAELEVTANAIMQGKFEESNTFTLTAIVDKIEKNKLTHRSQTYLRYGTAK
jgi:hypothetical protein